MEKIDTLNVTIRKIGNGFIVSANGHGEQHHLDHPEQFVPSFQGAMDTASEIIAHVDAFATQHGYRGEPIGGSLKGMASQRLS